MKKEELVAALAERNNITKASATHIIESIGAILENDLVHNGQTSCFGLGHLTVVNRAARPGVNPQTGTPIEIAARKVIKFKPSATVKRVVNG